MIVPKSRLLFWTGLLALPFSVLVAADPSVSTTAAVITGGFLALVLVDAVWALGRLDGIRATFPEVARLTKDREGALELEIQNDKTTEKRLRLAVALPAEIASPCDDIVTLLPEGALRSHVSWPCTPLKRGNYVLENVYLEANSPLGFWAIRKASPARTEVRVYPNILREQGNLSALFLNRGMVGIHAQRQVGKGREFEKLREYIPGDSYEDIHWKATAKRGRPVTKVFQIERTQEVYVVIDASRLSARVVERPSAGSRGSPGGEATSQLERFVTAAMVLGLAAEKQGDRFGFLAFNDQVQTFVRARNGKAHYGACRDALYTLQPKTVNPDFGELCSFIRLRLRRRTLLIFLTNLDDPVLAESFVRNVDLLARHHLVLVNMLTAPGVAPLFSEPEVASVDHLYEGLAGHLQWQKLRELEKVLKRRGVSLALLDNARMCPQLVSQYMNVKRRQLL